MSLIGYTRVSTSSQTDHLQRDALIKAGVDEDDIFSDVLTGSSASATRPGMSKLLAHVRKGDTVVVWRIDRLGRSLRDVVVTVDDLRARGIGVRSITDGIDPATTNGRLMLNLMATLAEHERELIRERVQAGVDAAKARGVKLGRPTLDPKTELRQARTMRTMLDNGATVADVAKDLGLSRATIYRRLTRLEAAEQEAGTR